VSGHWHRLVILGTIWAIDILGSFGL